MSDFSGQKCNVCGAINATNSTDWTRIPGLIFGPGRQPIMNVTPTVGVRRITAAPMLDFCPNCAAKTTVQQLRALAMPPK